MKKLFTSSTSSVLTLFLYLISTTAHAQTCGNILSSSSSTQIVPYVERGLPTVPLASNSSSPISLMKDSAHDLDTKMLVSGLTYSNFFKDTVIRNLPQQLNPEGALLHIRGLNSVEMNNLANKVFEDMQYVAQNATNGFGTEGIHDPAMASEIILKAPAQQVIDKVGEALVISATTGQFIDFSTNLDSKLIATSKSGRVKLYGFSGATLIVGATGIFFATGDLITTTTWLGSLVGTGIAAFKNRSSQWMNITQRSALEDLQSQINQNQTALNGYNFFQSPDKDNIIAQLNSIENYMNTELDAKRSSENDDYQIGRATGELRRQMSRLFTVEFAKWVSATQYKTLYILKDFKNIFESSVREQEFSTFENILAEAIEVTNMIISLNRKLITSLEGDITKLETMTPTNGQQVSYDQMIVNLKSRKLSQEQFDGTLELVLQDLRRSVVAVRAVQEADMNILTAAVLNVLNNNGDVAEIEDSNPVRTLFESISGLNGSLVSLDIAPDQATIGLSITQENLEDSIKECKRAADATSTYASQDSILNSCFEKLKEHMTAKQCRSLGHLISSRSSADTYLLKCITDLNPNNSELDYNQCKKIAEASETHHGGDKMVNECFDIFKNSMSQRQCQSLADVLSTYAGTNRMLKMCIEGN